MNTLHMLMDGRALTNIDSAVVLEVCHDLVEAQENIHDYGDDTCIVNVATGKIVDSLLWRRANEDEKSD